VPGQAEVHERDTDIVHVLGGSATLVNGGSAVDAKTIAPDEMRGASSRTGKAAVFRPATSSFFRTACRTSF
jgi:hypothetical protein